MRRDDDSDRGGRRRRCRSCRWPCPAAARRPADADDRRSPRPPVASRRRSRPRRCPTVKFVDITKDAGINFVHTNGGDRREAPARDDGLGRRLPRLRRRRRPGPPPRQLRRPGPATTSKPAPTQALYRNDGKGHFEDVTKAAGLDKTFFGMGVAVGDYDNDGDPDLYVTALGGGHLFRNDGKGHFDDVTAGANARGPNGWLTGAAFFDMENDGDLDLFVCQLRRPGRPRSTRPRASSSTGTGPGATARRPRSTARSAPCCATTAASSPTSARRPASRSARPT